MRKVERPPPKKARTAPRSQVVVCVDDDGRILASLRRLLRGEPYELLTTPDPHEALEWVRRRPVDLLITDERMPRMSGRELLRAVRVLRPETMLVVLTGFPDAALILERVRNAIERLFTKPWHDADLRQTIRDLLHLRPGGTPGGQARGA